MSVADTLVFAWRAKLERRLAEVNRIKAAYTILPCPWCGEPPDIVYDENPDEYNYRYKIICNNQNCTTECYCMADDPEILVKKWNTRNGVSQPIKREPVYCDFEI